MKPSVFRQVFNHCGCGARGYGQALGNLAHRYFRTVRLQRNDENLLEVIFNRRSRHCDTLILT